MKDTPPPPPTSAAAARRPLPQPGRPPLPLMRRFPCHIHVSGSCMGSHRKNPSHLARTIFLGCWPTTPSSSLRSHRCCLCLCCFVSYCPTCRSGSFAVVAADGKRISRSDGIAGLGNVEGQPSESAIVMQHLKSGPHQCQDCQRSGLLG